MLRSLALKNFKLFDDRGISIETGKITVLIGANGTGKSSVLQALLALKQSVGELSLETEGRLLKLGPFSEIVHAQDASRRVEVEMSATYEDFTISGEIEPFLSARGTFNYRTVLAPQVVEQSGSIIGGSELTAHSHWPPNPRHLNATAEPTGKVLSVGSGAASFAIYNSQHIGRPFRVVPAVLQESPAASDAERKVNALFLTIDELLRSYYFVPAIRGFEKRSYGISSDDLPTDLTAAGGPEEQAELVANILASDPRLAARVARWIDTVLGGSSGLGTRVERGRVVGETTANTVSVNLLNEAFGLNQVVAPLVWLGMAGQGTLIGIEEPEIHMHPRAQSALCDVFVEAATQRRQQLLLTTHSEHILMALLGAVAEGKLLPDDLAVYEFRREGGAARADRLEVNEYGQVEGGLRGFLEVDIQQLGKLIEARFGA